MKLHKTGGLHRVLALMIIGMMIAACSFNVTTAHITALKLFNDKAKKQTVSEFAKTDTIYAQAFVANVPSKVTLRFRLITVKVAGQTDNAPIPALDVSVDLAADGDGVYTLSPPENGWPAGKYRVEVAMLVDTGEQKDQKSEAFDIVDKG